MKERILKFFKIKPVFLFLLPVFFVLHGFTENYYLVPLNDALFLTLIYILFSLLLAVLFWLFYRNWVKAFLATVMLMSFHFFFGTVHDSLKRIFPGMLITRYIFILPVSMIIFLLVIILLKRSKRSFLKIISYLNLLLSLIILIDLIWLAGKIVSQKINSTKISLSKEFSECDSCSNPDFYLIILDEYAGHSTLKDIFKFDNSEFENQLRNRGFYLSTHSKSNYNYTPFSMASTLNMTFLDIKHFNNVNADLGYAYQTIKDNQVLQFLKSRGYEFYNYSIFEFKGQPARVLETFIPIKTRFITAQTFLSRLDRDIRFNTVSGKFQFKFAIKSFLFTFRDDNLNIYDLTWNVAEKKLSRPKFVYTHLRMPHSPYFYDKNGNPLPFEKVNEGNFYNKHYYLEYLQYTNTKVLSLVDHILSSSRNPPVIIIASDHGFRLFNPPVEEKYHFMNLSSVYLPSKNYNSFSDSTSNVNLFRIVLNAQYNQHLPLLKDSTIFLSNW